MVLGVFLDIDLLVNMAERYDLLTRVVSNYVGEWLFSIIAQVVERFLY